MGHGVLAPTVERLDLDAAATQRLGAGVAPGLLQSESHHAQHRMEAGGVAAPVRQRPGDAVVQHA